MEVITVHSPFTHYPAERSGGRRTTGERVAREGGTTDRLSRRPSAGGWSEASNGGSEPQAERSEKTTGEVTDGTKRATRRNEDRS